MVFDRSSSLKSLAVSAKPLFLESSSLSINPPFCIKNFSFFFICLLFASTQYIKELATTKINRLVLTPVVHIMSELLAGYIHLLHTWRYDCININNTSWNMSCVVWEQFWVPGIALVLSVISWLNQIEIRSYTYINTYVNNWYGL